LSPLPAGIELAGINVKIPLTVLIKTNNNNFSSFSLQKALNGNVAVRFEIA
jgi:hypothetical protein